LRFLGILILREVSAVALDRARALVPVPDWIALEQNSRKPAEGPSEDL
jgi:hypothetical protein